MIVGDQLASWMNDAEARRGTMERGAAAGLSVRALPAMAALHARLADADDLPPQEVLAAAQAFVTAPGAIEACVGALVDAARADPYFRPPLRALTSELHSGLVLLDSPQLSLMLAVLPPDALAAKRTFAEGGSAISFAGQRGFYHFLKAGGATLSFWEAPPCGADFTARDAPACRFVERRVIADGETIDLDGRHYSFVIEHASTDLVYVQALTPLGAGPLMREYDSTSLAFLSSSSTDDAGSRSGMMLSLLRDMERTDAVPVFAAALQDRHFYGRWHAMREFLALDAEAAWPYLEQMARADPHPEVRAAAAQTLAAFSPAQEPESCPA
jgi:hypothetical protein